MEKSKIIEKSETEALIEEFFARGGKVKVCRPAVAQGSEFTPNKHPFRGIQQHG